MKFSVRFRCTARLINRKEGGHGPGYGAAVPPPLSDGVPLRSAAHRQRTRRRGAGGGDLLPGHGGPADFRGECAASTWLCQIARNTWTSLRRKEGRCQPLDDTAALPDSRDFAAAFEDKDLALRIHRLLHRLPEPYREVFLLRVLGELSFRDIGSLFEKGENWACVTYHRARKKIMEQMEGTP